MILYAPSGKGEKAALKSKKIEGGQRTRRKVETMTNEKGVGGKAMLLLFAAAAMLVGSVCGATRVWTGGSGDWTDTANWLDNLTPSAGDTVYVSNAVGNVTINLDATGVSIASIRFEGKGLVTLTGNALTLTGAWSFPLETQGVFNKMNYKAGTFSFLAYGSDVECCVPLVISPASAGGICTATNTVHFRESITIADGKTMRIHNGLTPNNEDIAAGVPSGVNILTPIYFHKEIVGKNASITPNQAPCSDIYFYDAVKVKYINMSGTYTSPVVHLFSASNSFAQMSVEYGAMYYAEAAGAFPSNAILYLCNPYSTSSKAWFNLGNHDAVIDRVCDLDASVTATYAADTTRDIGSVMSTDSSKTSVRGNASPVTLTMKATADALTSCRIQDKVSIVWDPTDDYTLTFTNRASYTQGDITVKRGKVCLAGAASFPNVRSVTVATGAKFELATSVASPFSRQTLLRLASGAKLVVPAGVSVTVGMVSVDGNFVADNTYTGTGEGAVGWIEGAGSVTVAAASSGLCVWKNAASGTWNDSANWLNGRVPDGTESGTCIYCDSADDFTVSIASAVSAFPTNFSMANAGGGRTTLSVAADVVATKSSICVGGGARVKVEDGATFLHFAELPPGYNYQGYSSVPECAFTLENGGEWLVDGGRTVFTNFCGTFEIQASSRLAMQGGELLYCNRGSVFPLKIYAGGMMDLHDGNFILPHHGYNYNRDIDLRGGSLVFSNMTGSAGGAFSTPTGGGLIFGSGETVFAGTSIFPEMRNGSIYLVANGEGETAHFTMKDSSYFPDSHTGRSFVMGGPSGGKTLFDYEAGVSFPEKSLCMVVGNVSGEAEFNVKSGTFKVHNYGLLVAANIEDTNVFRSYPTTSVVAKVTVAPGTAMPILGSLNQGWNADRRICGIAVGYGNATVSPGCPFEGAMYVAGTVTNDQGCTVIGAGAGTGFYVQDGGETYLNQRAVYGFKAVTAVGMLGGKGALIVSNGTFTVAQSKMFVGGCLASEIPCHDNATTHAQVNWTARGLPTDAHDAQGKVAVVGGTLSAGGDVIVGSDGAGEIEMIGSSGTFTAGSLVLSNATASVVRFTADAAGVSPVNVAGKLDVTDGTEVAFDMSAYTGSKVRFRLFSFGSFSGDLEDVDLTVVDSQGPVSRPVQLVKDADSIDLVFIKGFSISIR